MMAKVQGKAKTTFIWKGQLYKKDKVVVLEYNSAKEGESLKQVLDNPKQVQSNNPIEK